MSDTSGVVADPNNPSFWWANNPSGEGLSYEQLKQRRAVAAALASRSRPYPTTIGQGLASVGEKFGDAMYQKQTDEYERAQRALDRAARVEAGGAPPPVIAPSGSGGRAGGRVDAGPLPGVPATSVAEAAPEEPAAALALAPDIDAGRNAIAQTATVNPNLLQMASLNTGTMSDAGQPGSTYGGPSPAGPGAPVAERPDTAPPDTSISAGRDAMVPSVMAQAGQRGNVEVRPTTPADVRPTTPAAGVLRQPPAAPAQSPPATFPLPGQSLTNEPPATGPIPPRPKTGVDTPQMQQIKRTLANPTYDTMSPGNRAVLEGQLERLKEARDKQDAQNMTEWEKIQSDTLERRKIEQERVFKQPEAQRAATKAMAEEVDMRRFGSAENKKALTEATNKRGDVAKEIAQNLPNLYEAERMLKERKLVAGAWADTGPGISTRWTGNVGLPGALDVRKTVSGIMGKDFSVVGPPWHQQVVDTEEFRAKMRPMVGAMAKKISPTGALSNMEINNAMEAMGIKGNLTQDSMLKIIQNLRREAYETIANHNKQMRSVFDSPQHDEKIIAHNRVEIPPDPEDVSNLKATPNSPEERARFDHIYGAGSARKILGFGR